MPTEPEQRRPPEPEPGAGMRRGAKEAAWPAAGMEVVIRRLDASSDPRTRRVRVVIMPGCVFDRP